MIYSNNALNILTAKTYKGIGKAWIVRNLTDNKSVNTIVSLLNRDAKVGYPITLADFEGNKEKIKQNIARLKEYTDGVIAIGDKHFPPSRGEVKNSEQPVVLFYRGDLSLLQAKNKNIAVIGLLNPDDEIEITEQKVVAELVKSGATILSGLASGCDTIAHRQALHSNGKTVAILPGPLNKIIPAKNKELAREIVKNQGLLVTEYYEDAKSKIQLSGRYKERDRLQALFSDSIILSASYAKNNQGKDSGSRLAMEYALNYSIPRYVIYDSVKHVNNPRYDLNRKLIGQQEGITVINWGNLSSAVKKIMLSKPDIKNEQKSLFDTL